jgi:DNA-binding MarR family transcriptional regulator
MLVTTASTTSLLDTLEKRGLVTRTTDPDDRRRQLVSITAQGAAIVEEFLPQIVALQTAIMEGISEPERRRFLKTLGAIREGMQSVDVDHVTASAPRRGQH